MAPMSMIETIAVLKDEREWRPGVTYDSIVSEANARVITPGVANMWSMPIRNRLDMLATGIKTSVGVKIYGPSLDTLDRIGRDIESLLSSVEGTGSAFAERAVGGRYLDVTVNREASARYGLTVDAVQDAMATAVGGADAGEVIRGRERYGVRVRYASAFRGDPMRLREVLVSTPSGVQVALGELATIRIVPGPTLIKSENAALSGIVYVDVRGRDIGSYVDAARRKVATGLTMPAGYRIAWSGQFESLERASRRLALIVPVTLLIVFGLLYLNFRNVAEVGIVMLSLPFSLIGGVWLMWLLHYNLSVAVWVGMIALAGLDAETGVLMLFYLNLAHRERIAAGQLRDRGDLMEAIVEGAAHRIRPKHMTVLAILLGLLPIMWGHGAGADVMKRIAAPMLGGVISSFVLELLVYPAVFAWWKGRRLPERVVTLPVQGGVTQ